MRRNTTSSGTEHLAPELNCSAEEGDTRVWLHANRTVGRRKLVYFPDTDVYHIGPTTTNTDEVIVQLSAIGRSLKLLHMNKFLEAISNDPDLNAIPTGERAKILQVLYIATGCDFTPFFIGIGKGAF